MIIIYKILGIALCFIGISLVLNIISKLTLIAESFAILFNNDSLNSQKGESTATLFINVIFIVIAFFCIKFGYKLIKSR